MANARGRAAVTAVLAAAGIAAGMFGPLVRAGVQVEGLGEASGEVTYHQIFATQGNVLLAICAVMLVMAFAGRGRWLWLCALGVWVTLLWDVIQGATTPKDDSLGGQIKDLISNKVSEVASQYSGAVFDVTHLGWGGYALLAGSLLVIWAAIRGVR